ncbi:uncharacterized protein LOC120111739 [Phoenix dactylifera]|uniref:Uncharacterized protein LOC120111739 n=1 Tax=Phoenix dactylifera TaxID=42345 RepID=A0A8B9ANF9_PHODC|nr:uncharacterized protein LOC120111739 [Phoenix dactylifera]
MARIFSASFFPSNSFRRLLSFGGSSGGDSAQTTGRIFPVSFFSSDSFFRRLRSFGSSDDPDQTTAESSHPSPRYADENPIPSAMEMETGSPAAAGPEQDSKRVRKLVPTVSLAVAALCCGIYASIPPEIQLHPPSPLFYDFLTAFVSLGVFTSLGLLMCSLVRPEGAKVAWVQKRVVTIAIIFFLIAFVLRIALLLPVASFGYVWLVFFLVAAGIALYLYAARKKDLHNQSARDPAYRLPISLPRTDGGGN